MMTSGFRLLVSVVLWLVCVSSASASVSGELPGRLSVFGRQLDGVEVSVFASEVCGYAPGDTVAVIPAGVTAVPDYAFAGAVSLRHVVWEDICAVTSLGEGCFKDCVALRRLAVPQGVEALPVYFCAGAISLSEVVLPDGLRDIGSHSFAYCGSLRRIRIPDGVEHIGLCAFALCEALEQAEIPASVTELESYAFSQCLSLRRCELPANDSLLGELIFCCCDALVEICVRSMVPPEFDCGSPLFEPSDRDAWQRCRLRVPAESAGAYRKAKGWDMFEIVEEI